MTILLKNDVDCFEFRILAYGSVDYAAELQLRNRVLREPLGLSLFDEDLSRDKSDIHIAAFLGSRLVGCLLLLPVNKTVLKMRQVAVDLSFRSKGLGGLMVAFAENYAQANGFQKIELNARETAVGFYQKNNYLVVGEQFFEVGIPHRKMQKFF